MKIEVLNKPSPEKLTQLNVSNWPIWEKEASSFAWTYDLQEVCYILQGKVTVTPQDGQPATIQEGDLVTFPKGMICQWDISKDIRKHYQFF